MITFTRVRKAFASVCLLVLFIGCGTKAPVTPAANPPAASPTKTPMAASGGIEDLISIEFPQSEYEWTLSEAAKGVQFEYRVIVHQDIPDVVPMSQTSAGVPGPSGLYPFPMVSGDGQSYSIVDTGLGPPPDMQPRTIKKSDNTFMFDWDGRNWDGPSDTCNPKGDPFPPGVYTFSISLVGEVRAEDGTMRGYDIKRGVRVTLK